MRDRTAGTDLALDSGVDGTAGGWETPEPSTVTGITYNTVPGSSTWTLQPDGWRQSPVISNNRTTKARVWFTSATANTFITIQLEVSSAWAIGDYAFISTLDNAGASYSSGYYSGSRICALDSVIVTIPVPTEGSHFVDIGYRKDESSTGNSDCAWFKVVE
jgi:hypothetical protein